MGTNFNYCFVYVTPKLDHEDSDNNNNDNDNDLGLRISALVDLGEDLHSAMKLFNDFCSKQFYLEKGYFYEVLSHDRRNKFRASIARNWDRDYYGKDLSKDPRFTIGVWKEDKDRENRDFITRDINLLN